MKVTLTLNGKSVDIDLTAEQMEAIGLKPEKKTGYEFVEKIGLTYCVRATNSDIDTISTSMVGDLCYKNANFYSDKTVAKNNARADRLIRQLRRFAAEHGGCIRPGKSTFTDCFEIVCGSLVNLTVISASSISSFISPALFATKEAAEAAIEAFRDELIWYFTEYDPMAPGYWED